MRKRHAPKKQKKAHLIRTVTSSLGCVQLWLRGRPGQTRREKAEKRNKVATHMMPFMSRYLRDREARSHTDKTAYRLSIAGDSTLDTFSFISG